MYCKVSLTIYISVSDFSMQKLNLIMGPYVIKSLHVETLAGISGTIMAL